MTSKLGLPVTMLLAQNHPEFRYWNDDQPWGTFSAQVDAGVAVAARGYRQANVTLADLLDIIDASPNDGTFVYASGSARTMIPLGLWGEAYKLAASLGFLHSEVAVCLPSEDTLTCSKTNVWLGSNGATAALHYDTSENVYCVFSGKKKFDLWSPFLLEDVNLFSTLHPFYRQSQVFWFVCCGLNPRGQLNTAQVDQIAKSCTVTLNTGDLLFLPSYWLHRVTSVVGGPITVCAPFTVARAQALVLMFG